MKKLILNGKVKDVRFIVYKIEENELNKVFDYRPLSGNSELLIRKNGRTIQKNYYGSSGQLWRMEKYDEKGNTTAVRSYDRKGKLIGEILYKYNARGKIVEQTSFQDGRLPNIQTFSYDSTGKLVEEAIYKFGETLFRKRFYSYDSQGNLQEINTFSPRDRLLEKKTFKYNSENRKIEEAECNSEGKLLTKTVWEYDKQGKLIRETRFEGEVKKRVSRYNSRGQETETVHYQFDGKLSSSYFYEYDPEGNLTVKGTVSYNSRGQRTKKSVDKYDTQQNLIENAVYFYPAGDPGWKTVYQYDNFGNLTQRKYYGSRGLEEEETLKYDPNGNLLERNINNIRKSRREVWTYEYEFDEQGNWIKRIDYRDGTAMYLVKREIEYFE